MFSGTISVDRHRFEKFILYLKLVEQEQKKIKSAVPSISHAGAHPWTLEMAKKFIKRNTQGRNKSNRQNYPRIETSSMFLSALLCSFVLVSDKIRIHFYRTHIVKKFMHDPT